MVDYYIIAKPCKIRLQKRYEKIAAWQSFRQEMKSISIGPAQLDG